MTRLCVCKGKWKSEVWLGGGGGERVTSVCVCARESGRRRFGGGG